MSAKGRGAQLRANRNYPTPSKTINSFLDELYPLALPNLKWGEPCAGDGAMIREMLKRGVEPGNWEWAEIREGKDYLLDGLTGRVDAIITNPDFSIAQEFIERSLRESKFSAYLLRLNFFGSRKRREWWQGKEPTHLFTLAERPSFVDVCKGYKSKGIGSCGASYLKDNGRKVCDCGGIVGAGTDATEYAWFVWDEIGLCKRDPGMYVI